MPVSSKKICYNCIVTSNDPVEYLKPELTEILKPLSRHMISNYAKLDGLRKEKYLVEFTSAGEVKLHVVDPFSKELKTFLVQISSKLL